MYIWRFETRFVLPMLWMGYIAISRPRMKLADAGTPEETTADYLLETNVLPGRFGRRQGV
jgi:hypothetical protein